MDQIFRDQKSGLKIRIGQLAGVEVVDNGVIAIDEGMSDEYFVVGRVLSRNGLEQLEIYLGGFVQKREPLWLRFCDGAEGGEEREDGPAAVEGKVLV